MDIQIHSGDSDVTREVEIQLQEGSINRSLKIVFTETVPGVGPIKFERRFPGASFVKFGIPAVMIQNEEEPESHSLDWARGGIEHQVEPSADRAEGIEVERHSYGATESSYAGAERAA